MVAAEVHVLVRSAHRECVSVQWCDITSEFQFNAGRSTGLKNQSAHVVEWTVSTKLFARGVTSQEPHQGGYAGVRLEKCRTQGQPNTKEITQKKNASARRTSINEAGDAVPGSQDSITRGVQNLQLADVPAAQPASPPKSVPTMCSVRRGPACLHRQFRQWMSEKHGGQTLTQVSVAQLRRLDRAACVTCGTIRSRDSQAIKTPPRASQPSSSSKLHLLRWHSSSLLLVSLFPGSLCEEHAFPSCKLWRRFRGGSEVLRNLRDRCCTQKTDVSALVVRFFVCSCCLKRGATGPSSINTFKKP